MNTIRRDGASDDTGEQDVRELRQRFNAPHVRHKEDVPHEGSLPDFYGLGEDEEVPTLQEVKDELSSLVDEGELCMGWDADEQAFVYWFPETSEPEEAQPAPEPRSRRAQKPRRRSRLYQRVLLTLAASVAPFFVGMTAEAALDMHVERNHPMDQPDMASDEIPSPAPTPVRAGSTYHPYVPVTPARHARATTSPTAEKPGSYVGKHRKPLPVHTAASLKTTKKTESKAKGPAVSSTPKPSPTPTSKPTTAPSAPVKQAPHTPVEVVVTGVLGTVTSLLG